jgi:hypothetical protein
MKQRVYNYIFRETLEFFEFTSTNDYPGTGSAYSFVMGEYVILNGQDIGNLEFRRL